MKTFRDYLSEEVMPTALVADGSFDLENPAVRAQINIILAGISSHSCVTPYHALRKISKALAYFHIILPKKTYMEGERGLEVYELQQFGHKMGMTDQGEFISGVPPKHYLYMSYSQVMGRFLVTAKVVGEDELDRLVSLQEDAAARQMVAKAMAPKEDPHTALGDCDCSQGDSPSTKKAVEVSMRRKDKKLSADSLDEAMTRKQKDMAVRRFMSHDPKAGETILTMGKKDREEKKSFASAKKEVNRLKEADSTNYSGYKGGGNYDPPDQSVTNALNRQKSVVQSNLPSQYNSEYDRDTASSQARTREQGTTPTRASMEEGRMPASVIKHKQKLDNMTPDELKKKFAGKSEQELKSMARRHGYGPDSDVYSKHVTVKEESDAADETNMAKTQLKAIGAKSSNLASMMKNPKNLPAWVQSKLSVAKDGITSVDDYMTHSDKKLDEKAPPGAKYERMVKHIKAGYAKDGLTKKEKGIAFATAWKAKNKEKSD